MSYGKYYDLSLNENNCLYDKRKDLFLKLKKYNLNQIIDNSLNFNFDSSKNESKEKQLTNFNMIRNNKNILKISNKLYEQKNILNYNHMKTLLGHISIIDNINIVPVPIFCLCFSDDDSMLFTGDNNGVIKIWSTKTGILIDVFKNHDKPINELFYYHSYLISCSEDQSIIVWNIKILQMEKIYNFEESIVRLVGFDYKNGKKSIKHILIIISISGKIYFISLDDLNDDENDIFPGKFYLDRNIIEKKNLKKNKQIQQSSVAVNNKMEILVCGYNDGLICVWDIKRIFDDSIKNKKFISDFSSYVLFLEYVHNSMVQFAEFCSSGKFFITASVDGSVIIWTVKDYIINLMRINILESKKIPILEFPIYCIQTITESEDRVRSCVNVAMWTKKNNYVVIIISSKPRKKYINEVKNNQKEINNNQNILLRRSSSLIVYSISLNNIIKKYNELNGFHCHDECFVLESHPLNEEIILTISGTNNIVLFNFLTGEIIKEFTENNFFFSNISQSIIASEGKFTSKGDYFVISTFLGFISIYSIYSRNSYLTTYMNQFITSEFNSESLSKQEQLSLIFPKYVNMYDLPYIIEQPYSQFKIRQINFLKENLRNKYNISSRIIEEKYMKNNFQNYEYFFEERILECQKEEEAFKQAEKDNMNYRLSNNDEREEVQENEEESYNDDNYNNNEELSNSEDYKNDDSLNDDNKMNIENEEDEISNRNNYKVNYNLRHRHNSTNINVNPNRNYNLRSINNDNENNSYYIHTRSHDHLINNINYHNHNSLRIRHKLRLRRNNYDNNQNNINNINHDNYNENNLNTISEENSDLEYQQAIEEFGRKKKKNIKIEDDESEEKKDIEEDEISKINKEIIVNELISKANLNVEHECFCCKFKSLKTLGPFYLDFLNGIKISFIKTLDYEKEIYLDFNCLFYYNDFICIDKHKKRFDIIKTITNIIKNEKICFRCGGQFANKKCTNNNCERYFHGNFCLKKLCVESQNSDDNCLCLECYKDYFEVELNENFQKIINGINMNLVSKNFFLEKKLISSVFFPQKGEEIYFIYQAYEAFLQKYYPYIIYEIKNKIFFWEKCFEINHPILCKIINISYEFQNLKTLAYIKKFYGQKNLQNNIKILIRIQLYHEEENKEFEIIFFENDLPDFLIRRNYYEKTKQYYEEIICKNKNNIIQIYLGNECYEAKILNDIPQENNFYFSNSKYNSLKIKYINQNYLQENDDEETQISFWDIYNSEGIMIDGKWGKIQEKILSHLISIMEKNKKDLKVFFEPVDEIKDNALNYYNVVPVPMYLTLIKERLSHKYYLTQESFIYDIDLINSNSKLYNENSSVIVRNAQILINKIYEILNNLNKSFEINKNNTDSDSKILTKKRKRIERDLGFNYEDEDDYLFMNNNQRSLRKRKIISVKSNSDNENEENDIQIKKINKKGKKLDMKKKNNKKI